MPLSAHTNMSALQPLRRVYPIMDRLGNPVDPMSQREWEILDRISQFIYTSVAWLPILVRSFRGNCRQQLASMGDCAERYIR